eukprot:7380075-Prymnesium_polylepis.3
MHVAVWASREADHAQLALEDVGSVATGTATVVDDPPDDQLLRVGAAVRNILRRRARPLSVARKPVEGRRTVRSGVPRAAVRPVLTDEVARSRRHAGRDALQR